MLSKLVQAARTRQGPAREKKEEEGAAAEGLSPEAESPGASSAEEEEERVPVRRVSSSRLPRQDYSVREEVEEEVCGPGSQAPPASPSPPPPPEDRHSRTSLEEQQDDVAPLSHYRPRIGGFSSFRGGQRKMLVSTHSDADSAVSMVGHCRSHTALLGLARITPLPSSPLPPSPPSLQSFDREEMELELQRRSSSSICTAGLFHLNLTEPGAVDVAVEKDAGYTCERRHWV